MRGVMVISSSSLLIVTNAPNPTADQANMSSSKKCWPSLWLKAAVKAGLAIETDFGAKFEDDEIADKLAIFAEEIWDLSEKNHDV